MGASSSFFQNRKTFPVSVEVKQSYRILCAPADELVVSVTSAKASLAYRLKFIANLTSRGRNSGGVGDLIGKSEPPLTLIALPHMAGCDRGTKVEVRVVVVVFSAT